jgi:diacylglycerol kinase family enzyme
VLQTGPSSRVPGKLALAVLRNRPWRRPRIVRDQGRRIEIRLRGEPREVSTDGETMDPVDRLVLETVPRAVTVVAP